MNVVKNILFAAFAVTATAFAPVLASSDGAQAAAPSCCAKGNCCASGSCCGMEGCCKADKSCCDPTTGVCTSACGCLTMNCCDSMTGMKKADVKSRGHFVTQGKATFWVAGTAPVSVAKAAAASCCAK